MFQNSVFINNLILKILISFHAMCVTSEFTRRQSAALSSLAAVWETWIQVVTELQT